MQKILGIGFALFWLGVSFSFPLAGEAAPVDEQEVKAATAVKERHEASLFGHPGVRGVGVGLTETGDKVAIHVYVDASADKSSLPSQLDGVPVRLIETGGFRAHDGPPGDNHRLAYALPVPMGVSTSNVNGTFAGTLGFRCTRIGDASNVGYVTNNHVAAASGPSLCPAQLMPGVLPAFGVNECQPGTLDAGGGCTLPPIGGLVQVVPLVMGPAFLNTVDAAFVKSNRGCVSNAILDIGVPTANARFPVLGDIVQKSGRTTGFTMGTVTTINATVDVGYGAACGTARFVGQAIVTPIGDPSMSLPGDSGAPMLAGPDPVGLNFAGDGTVAVINPMPAVLNALGVEIDTAPDDPPSVSCFP